mmetsp:Transcript_1027/g.3046  ORF Transcript_1027/g.3046 Transcript_1027/m.3046 type:complete len:91 (+) Transcript_1027:871-1143(+)
MCKKADKMMENFQLTDGPKKKTKKYPPPRGNKNGSTLLLFRYYFSFDKSLARSFHSYYINTDFALTRVHFSFTSSCLRCTFGTNRAFFRT